MAFANNTFSEAAFASESAGITNVVPTGFGLTANSGTVTITGTIGVDAPVTGFDLTVNVTTEIQDTLFAFAEAPFATQSPSTFSPPNVTVGIVSNAAVTGIAMTASLGTAITVADANVTATGLPLTAALGTAAHHSNTSKQQAASSKQQALENEPINHLACSRNSSLQLSRESKDFAAVMS